MTWRRCGPRCSLRCRGPALTPLPATRSFQGNVKLLLDDVAALRPTLFIAVPRILERIADGVKAKLDKAGGWSKVRRPWKPRTTPLDALGGSWGALPPPCWAAPGSLQSLQPLGFVLN